MARAASAWVSVRGSPARSASSLHAAGMRTRSSPAREGRASSTRAITASMAGIPAIYPTFPRWLDCRTLSCSFSAGPARRSGRFNFNRNHRDARDHGQTAAPQIWAFDQFRKWLAFTPDPQSTRESRLRRNNAPARRPFRGSQFIAWLASILMRPWTRKGAYASAGRNDSPANATPRTTICPTIDREQLRHLWVQLR